MLTTSFIAVHLRVHTLLVCSSRRRGPQRPAAHTTQFGCARALSLRASGLGMLAPTSRPAPSTSYSVKSCAGRDYPVCRHSAMQGRRVGEQGEGWGGGDLGAGGPRAWCGSYRVGSKTRVCACVHVCVRACHNVLCHDHDVQAAPWADVFISGILNKSL